jgi:hypothetical protein
VDAVDNGGALVALFIGPQATEGGQSKGGRHRRWNLNNTGYRRWKQGRGVMGCDHFRRGRRGGGEPTPRCRRRTTRQRSTRLGRWAECMVGSNC